MTSLIAIILVGVTALSVETWGINPQCVDFSSFAISPDDKWIKNVPKWYFSLQSRGFADFVARFLLGRASEQMNPNDVIFRSCALMDVFSSPEGWGTFTVSGYGGYRKNIVFKPVHGLEVIQMCDGDVCERGYNTMTDNQTFIVAVFCMSSGDMKWIAFSAVKTLPESTKQLIFRHVENLGFKREYFIEQRWDYCPQV